ncbi:MAG: hypothetical protein ACRDRL_20645 [Sciscionella sp.]
MTSSSPDVATWSPATARTPDPVFGAGRAPRMTYLPWHRSQTTELGATDRDAWYRRCLTRGCRIWAGPYGDAGQATEDGMWHQHHAHDRAVCAPGGSRD